MQVESPEPGFDLLYEQGPCLVVSKPPGVLTQAPPGIDSLEVRIKQFLLRRDARAGTCYLGMPHRLDRPATGALVVARQVQAARRLSEQFEGRMIRKVYLAIVQGVVTEDQGTWTDYLRKIPDVARSEVVEPTHADARLAILHFRVIRREAACTWLRIELETGRNHQIRVQAAFHGHPLLGDELYGAQAPFGLFTADPRERQIALHAYELGFEHPLTRQAVAVVAPLPTAWPKVADLW